MTHDRRHRQHVNLLWGRSDRFPRPQFITAFNDGLVDAYHEEYCERRDEAIAWFLNLGDEDGREGWTFWETVEALLIVVPPFCTVCRRLHENDDYENVCECDDSVFITTCECDPCGEGREHNRSCPRYEIPT